MRKPNSRHIKIIVATPNAMTSHLLAQPLEENPEFVVVDRVSDVEQLCASMEVHSPSVLLVSIHLKALAADRFQRLSHVLAMNSKTSCIVLLDNSEPETVVDAFRARARGVFVCGDRSTESLQKCIQRVVEGQVWADSTQLNYLIAALPGFPIPDNARKRKISTALTAREEEVVWQLADGLSNREIASRLQISENTVKNYVCRIFDKLGFSNRVEVVLYAASRMQQRPPESDAPIPVTQPMAPIAGSADLSRRKTALRT